MKAPSVGIYSWRAQTAPGVAGARVEKTRPPYSSRWQHMSIGAYHMYSRGHYAVKSRLEAVIDVVVSSPFRSHFF